MTDEINELRTKLLSSSKNDNKFLKYIESEKSLLIRDFGTERLVDICVQLVYQDKTIEIASYDSQNLAHIDKSNILNTNYDKEKLSSCLISLYRNSKEAIHSYGSSILYLAIGFLERNDSTKAPITLIPVELKKSEAGKYSLQWTGEDPFTSLALQKDVKNVLPNFPVIDDGNDLESYTAKLELYFENTKAAILDNDWIIHYNVALDFFSNKNYQMYLDLDPDGWGDKIKNHPVLQELYSMRSGDETLAYVDNIKLNDTYRVFADDLSHIAAIEAVKSGRNLLIDGGPGTGKSQTIVGMITELLGREKKVLFISDKQPAIDVVYRRLDKDLGLGNFCFILHSDKLKKDDIYNDILSAWDDAGRIKKNRMLPEYSAEKLKLFDSKKEMLDKYAVALSEIRCKRNLTTYKLFGLYEKSRRYFKKAGHNMVEIDFENPEEWTSDDWTKAISALEELNNFSDTYVSDVIWNGCDPGPVGQQDVSKIGKQINECLQLHKKMEDNLDRVCRICSLNPLLVIGDIDAKIIPGMQLLMESQSFENAHIPNIMLVLKNGSWQEIHEDIVPKLIKLDNMKTDILRYFNESIFDIDQNKVENYANANELKRSLDPQYKEFIVEVRGHCTDNKKDISEKILTSKLKLLSEYEDIKKELDAEENLETYLGSYWKVEKSDVGKIKKLTHWAESFQKAYKEDGIFSDNVFDLLGSNKAGNVDETNAIFHKHHEALNDIFGKFNQGLNALFNSLNTSADSLFGNDINSVQLCDLISRLDLWSANLSSLSNREQILSCEDRCLDTVAKDIISHVRSGNVLLEDIHSTFEGNYAKKLLNEIIKEPVLFNVTSNYYSKTRDDFIEIEDEILELNSSKLSYELCSKITTPSSTMAGMGTPENLLRSKKLPIYSLMDNARELIQEIKPCFMMSPTSVAQYLPKKTYFDVVIFDEASQLKTEDAMGSILRAKQFVVCGDMNQMPPSNYFEKIIENTDYVFDDSIVSLTNVQSILEMANTKMENRTLDWHYRSKHESLIAVPNDVIYKNRFYVHPSPKFDAKDLGLNFILYREGVYLAGEHKSINPLEAKKIVKDVFDYHSKYPSRTIGIATFSRSQMDIVQKEIDLILRDHPKAKTFFDTPEYFFVKNLENVQGDERDAIFLSICYGYNQDGKFIPNFGPINKAGGDKKLNVFITRAREKCSVYANFSPDEIKIVETTSDGVKLLKKFMTYADKRDLKSTSEEISDNMSDLGECVCDLLKENGYNIKKNYGVGKYYLDIVVENPVIKGQFLAAILLDGSLFYSTKNTRDRVRTHHEVLKNMGWNLYYILSPEWHQNADIKEKELLTYLENAKNKSKEEYSSDIQDHKKPDEPNSVHDEDDKLRRDTQSEDSSSNKERYMSDGIEKKESPERIMHDNSSDEVVTDNRCPNCGAIIDFTKKPKFCSQCAYKLS